MILSLLSLEGGQKYSKFFCQGWLRRCQDWRMLIFFGRWKRPKRGRTVCFVFSKKLASHNVRILNRGVQEWAPPVCFSCKAFRHPKAQSFCPEQAMPGWPCEEPSRLVEENWSHAVCPAQQRESLGRPASSFDRSVMNTTTSSLADLRSHRHTTCTVDIWFIASILAQIGFDHWFEPGSPTKMLEDLARQSLKLNLFYRPLVQLLQRLKSGVFSTIFPAAFFPN